MKPKHIKTGGETELVLLTRADYQRLKRIEEIVKARADAEREEEELAMFVDDVHPLRFYRERSAKTQIQIASACHVTQGYVSRVETRKVKASPEFAECVRRILPDMEIDISQILL